MRLSSVTTTSRPYRVDELVLVHEPIAVLHEIHERIESPRRQRHGVERRCATGRGRRRRAGKCRTHTRRLRIELFEEGASTFVVVPSAFPAGNSVVGTPRQSSPGPETRQFREWQSASAFFRAFRTEFGTRAYRHATLRGCRAGAVVAQGAKWHSSSDASARSPPRLGCSATPHPPPRRPLGPPRSRSTRTTSRASSRASAVPRQASG